MLGKIFGGFLGYASFGFFGLIVGLMIGHWFDKGLAGSILYMQQDLAKSQATFFKLTFEVMGAIAKADGHVSQAEIQFARQVMRQLQLNTQQEAQAISYFNQGKQAGYNLEAALIEFRQSCGRNPNLVRFFLEIQLQAAFSEGHLSSPARRILERICYSLGISTYFIDELAGRSRAEQDFYRHRQAGQRPSSQTETQDAYGILGLTPSVSDADLKKAYRRLMSQHHPDKLAAKGLPESMKKMATEKTQKIQKAYEVICKRRGI